MSFGQFILLVFVSLNYFYSIVIALKKKRPFESWTSVIRKHFWTPIVFPYAVFLFGFVFFDGFAPSILCWTYVPQFWTLYWTIMVVTIILNLVIYYFKSDDMLSRMDREDRKEAAYHGDDIKYVIGSVFALSLTVSFLEEFLFRVMFFVGLQPLVHWIIAFTGTAELIALIPSWLSLGFSSLVSPSVFLTAFLINIFFAIGHKKYQELDNLWHRVIFAWIGGWVYFLALYYFGFLGAVAAHLLDNFFGFTPIVYLLNKKAGEAYWKDRNGG